MRRYSLLFGFSFSLLLVLSLLFFSMMPQTAEMWSKTYGGPQDDSCCSIVQTVDGGYALAGYTRSFGAGKADFWLIKVDGSGDVEWNQTYGGPESSEANCLVQTSDGGYALAGYILSRPYNFWLVKTDAYGNMEWNKTYGGPEYDVAYSVIQTTDGGYVLAGHTSSFASGDSDFWLIKTDENGNMEWNQTYGGPGYDEAFSVIQTDDGGYAVVGQTHSSSAGYADFWLVKTDAYGNMVWNQKYGGTEYDIPNSLIQTSDGGYALVGTTNDTPRPEIYDIWLVKTDAYGNMEWNKQYGGLDQENAYSVIQTSDGGYALAGDTHAFAAGGRDVWLVKTDAYGNMEWSKTYGGSGADVAHSLVQASDGGYAMAGETTSFSAGERDFWVIKTDKFGFIDEISP